MPTGCASRLNPVLGGPTSAEFDEHRATDLTREFFELSEWETGLL